MSEEIRQGGAVPCKRCGNTGVCPRCEGRGWNQGFFIPKDCDLCERTGNCPCCNGTGWIVIPTIIQR